MSLTSSISSAINGVLNKAGYALVDIKGGRGRTTFKVRGDERFGYESALVLDLYAPWAADEDFGRVWGAIKANTLTDIWRSHELYQLVREVAPVVGDVLEVGVWRGGTGAALAAAAKRWKPDARVWLCDTFSGVVKAGSEDSSYDGGEHADTSAKIVTDLLDSMNLDNATILKGIFPDETGADIEDRSIALCHVDVDVYQSAADVVAWVKPRMASGGVIVFDDYGFSSTDGVTRLVNGLRNDGDWIYLYNLNKHAVLIRR